MENTSFTVNITNSKVDSFRKSEIKKTGIRLYNEGDIGVAGYIGDLGEEIAEKNAVKSLMNKISYPCESASNINKKVEIGEFPIKPDNIIEEVEEVLKELNKFGSDFIFSNKASLIEDKIHLSNNSNTKMDFTSKYMSFGLLYKTKESVSLFDGFFGFMSHKYNRKEWLDYSQKFLEWHRNLLKVKLEKKMPVIFLEPGTTLSKFNLELSGRKYSTQTSIFSKKQGDKLFNEKFNLINNRESNDNYLSYFDAEGTILNNNKFYFIKDGIFKAPSSDKQLAKEFGYELTGSAVSAYDTVPVLGRSNLDVEITHNNLEDMLKGQKAIVVLMASGGDFTTEGSFGTPVQLSFLYENGKILGRLPELQLNSNIYKMFGDDFKGSVKNSLTPFSDYNIIAMDMEINQS